MFLLPYFINFTSDTAIYARINGPVIKRNGLYQNAEAKSNFAIDISILEIPHPGHFKFVIS